MNITFYTCFFCQNLRVEMKKRKKNSAELYSLMSKTFSSHQEWIKNDAPSVQEILEEYPALRNSKVVSVHNKKKFLINKLK